MNVLDIGSRIVTALLTEEIFRAYLSANIGESETRFLRRLERVKQLNAPICFFGVAQ
jgi:ribose 5-phosphate isomerase RpiB